MMITKGVAIKMGVAGASAATLFAFSDIAINAGSQIINLYKAATTAAEIRQIDKVLLLQITTNPGKSINFENFMKTKFYSSSKDAAVDYWGNPYQYEELGRDEYYRISSYGPDGAKGSSDDIIFERRGTEVKSQSPEVSLEIIQSILKKAEKSQEEYVRKKMREEQGEGNSKAKDAVTQSEIERIRAKLIESKESNLKKEIKSGKTQKIKREEKEEGFIIIKPGNR